MSVSSSSIQSSFLANHLPLLEQINRLEDKVIKELLVDRIEAVANKVARNREHQSLRALIDEELSETLLDKTNISQPDRERALKILQTAKQQLNADGSDKLSPRSENLQFLERIKQQIQAKEYEEAFKNLKALRFDFSKDQKVIAALFACLHAVLPHLKASDLFSEAEDPSKSFLRAFLEQTSLYSGEQRQLALDLADCYSRSPSRGDAFDQIAIIMHFLAKAIALSIEYHLPHTDEIHQKASQLFMQVIASYLVKTQYFSDKLQKSLSHPQKFKEVFEQIELLKKYCCSVDDMVQIQKIYQQARDVFNQIPNTLAEFKNFAADIRKGLFAEWTSPSPFVTRNYWKALNEFRDSFKQEFKGLSDKISDYEKVRSFQRNRWEAFKDFVANTLLQDTFHIFGLASRMHDVRGMGSFAREEICPYSDLEWFILVNKEEDKPEFMHFAKLFLIQVASLDETAITSIPVFTALGEKNRSGLHSDGQILVDTPAKIAAYQSVGKPSITSPTNLLLTSQSLHQTNETLFEAYHLEIKKLLPESIRRKRALDKIKERLFYFKQDWSKSIDQLESIHLKELFVEPLFHLLGDFKLYFGLTQNNTLDIVDALVKNKIFDELSGKLLKKVVAGIYMIRVRLHLYAKEQCEVIPWRKSKRGFRLTDEERLILEQAYWLILVPLYAHLENCLANQSFAEMDPMNLLELSLDKLSSFSSRPQQNLALKALITFLTSRKSSGTTHLNFFKKLSQNTQLEPLRRLYLKILQDFPKQESVIQRLSMYPNLTGTRIEESRQRERLHNQLLHATTTSEESGKRGFKVILESPLLAEKRYLTKEILNTILDEEGNIHRDEDNSTNRVAFVASDKSNCYLHFKQQPAASSEYSFYPGKEQAVSRLMMRLFGHGASISELVKFTVTHPSIPPKCYLVLVSQTVNGKTLNKMVQAELSQLEQIRLSELFLAVPLIVPGDLREANFIFTETDNEKGKKIRQLVCVDNDIAWVRALTRNSFTSSVTIHLYNMLFIRFPDLVIHPKAIKRFLNLKPGPLLRAWFEEMEVWNAQASVWFKEFENLKNGFTPLCLFEKGFGTQMMAQFCRLQAYLTQNRDKSILALDLLKTCIQMENEHLVDIGYTLHRFYHQAVQNPSSPAQSLKAITNRRGTTSLSMSESQNLMFQKLPTTEETKGLFLPEQAIRELDQLVALHFDKFIFLQSEETCILERGFKPEPGEQPHEETQRAVLNGLLLHRFKKLNLSYCLALSDELLKKFLEKSAAHLKYLDLRHCPGISDDALAMIAEKCSVLEELYLDHCPELAQFKAKFLIFKGTALQFPQLKFLSISHCPKLRVLRLLAPKLELLEAHDNAMLKEATIESIYAITPNFANCPLETSQINNKGLELPSQKSSPKNEIVVTKAILESSGSHAEDTEEKLFESCLNQLIKNYPAFLRDLQQFVLKHKEPRETHDYIKNSIGKKFVELIDPFLKRNPKNTLEELFKGFCVHCMQLSLSKDSSKEKANEEPLEELFARRQLFLADDNDYSLEAESSSIPLEELKTTSPHEEIINRILSHLQQAEPAVQQALGKSIISLIGNTGVGKSTSANYLLGCPMEERASEDDPNEKQIVAMHPIARIGHTLKSETFIPSVFADETTDLIFADLPGFLENRGPEINISNAANIRALLSAAASNRILLQINCQGLFVTRGEDFKNAVKILIKFFGSVDQLNRSMASIIIAVTRLPADRNFDSIVKKIVAIAEEEKWHLQGFEGHIFPLDPLERGVAWKRDTILDRLRKLPSLESIQGLYSTALTDEDRLLIQEIGEKSAERLSQLWGGWHIEAIVAEYQKLATLGSINHPTIHKVAADLRAEIQRLVKELIGHIYRNVQSDVPKERVQLKRNLARLERCKSLDHCFIEEKVISQQVIAVQNAVRTVEMNAQTKINVQIEGGLASLIEELALDLKKLIRENRAQLAQLNFDKFSPLQSLLIQCSLASCEHLEYLFQQMDKETSVRQQKYFFKDLVPLAALKGQKMQELERLILQYHHQAKVEEFDQQFAAAYQKLYLQIAAATAQKFSELSSSELDLTMMAALPQWGFDPQATTELQNATRHLQSLVQENVFNGYLGRIGNFFREIFIAALRVSISKSLEIEEHLPEELQRLEKQLSHLKNLHKGHFVAAQDAARRAFVEKPQQQLAGLAQIVDDSYRFQLIKWVKKLGSIRGLPSCFTKDEVVTYEKAFEETIKAHEIKKRTAELHQFGPGLDTLWEEARAHINNYLLNNYEGIAQLNFPPQEVDNWLQNLQKLIPQLTSFCAQRLQLKIAIKSQASRYYFTQDNQLTTFLIRFEAKLVDDFTYISAHAKTLQLQQQIEQLLKELNQEAQLLLTKFPEKIVRFGLMSSSGFTPDKIQRLYKLRAELANLLKNHPTLKAIRNLIVGYEQKFNQFKEDLVLEARKKSVEEIVTKITDATQSHSYLAISDDLPDMLATLQALSEEIYQKVIRGLGISLAAWQENFDNVLTARNYTDVVNAFILIGKLQKNLGAHLAIDAGPLQTLIIRHLEALFNEAFNEIECEDGGRENYFEIEKLKNFIAVLRQFESHKLNLQQNLQDLKEKAMQGWKKLTNSMPKQLEDYVEVSKFLAGLTRKVIKQYAIANELSLLKAFQTVVRQLFGRFSDELIYKFGLAISEFTGHGSFMDATARKIIDDFDEFERINIKLFNSKASGVTFPLALEKLTSQPDNSDNNRKLQIAYDHFHKFYSYFLNQIVHPLKPFKPFDHVVKTKKLAKELSGDLNLLSTETQKTAELLAHIFAYWSYLNSAKGYFSGESNTLLQPHSTQVLTLLRLLSVDEPGGLKDHLIQIKTGEGKSITLGIAATLFGLLGYRVNVACYSSYLSSRDEKAFTELFRAFNLFSWDIKYSTIDGLVEDALGSHLPNFREHVRQFLKGKKTNPFTPTDKKNLLLLDEVDVFFGKNFYGKVRRPALPIQTKGTAELLRYIWKEKSSLRKLDKQVAVDQLLALPCTQTILEEYPNLKSFLPSEISSMISYLAHYPDSGEIWGSKPIVQDDQVGYIDKAGNLSFAYSGYNLAFAYLYYREKGEIKSDRHLEDKLSITITTAQVLFSAMPNFFNLKLGLTATLEGLTEEENAILKHYGFDKRSFIPSTFQKQVLVEAKTEVIDGKREDFFKRLKTEIDTVLRQNRAALIVHKNTKRVQEFQDYLKNIQRNQAQFKLPELLTEMIPDSDRAAIISRAISQYKITQMTHLFGRGIDFICRDNALIKNGGVHVILAFYPKNLVDEIQIKGRTCRQDDPGSIIKILFAEDLMEQGFVPERRDENYNRLPDLHEFNESDEQDWDLFLTKKRQEKYTQRLKKIQETLQSNTIQHQKSLDLAQAIEKGDNDTALKILKEFNP